MLDVAQFKEFIVIPALTAIDAYSESALNLLLGTAIVESRLKYIKQINGPALGVYQMEPNSYEWLLEYIAKKPFLLQKIKNYCNYNVLPLNANTLIDNLAYATIMARVKYLTIPQALPEHDNLNALAVYWKKYYNSHLGKGNPLDFIRLYKEHVNA